MMLRLVVWVNTFLFVCIYFAIFITALKIAFRAVLHQYEQELMDKKSKEAYEAERDKGVANYFITVTIPSFICKYCFFNNCKLSHLGHVNVIEV